MKEIKAFSNNNIQTDSVSTRHIKEGDKFYYRVVEHLGKNKYLVNILGAKITATINEKVPNNGFVKVVNVGNELVLKIVKENSNLENKNIAAIMESKAKDLLVSNGVSASNRNISYLDTVLKYMANISDNQKATLLNFISKGNYLSVNELETLFSQNVYIILSKRGFLSKDFSKISKTKPFHSDNYKAFINSAFDGTNTALTIKNTVDNNGYLPALLLLLDKISNDEKDSKDKLKLLINTLSLNRVSKLLKERVYYFQVPLNFEGSNRDIKLFIETDRDDKRKLNMAISVFENNKELCSIKIKRVFESYNVVVSIYEKLLYDKYIKNESSLLNEVSSIKNRTGVQISVGAVYES